MCGPYKFNAKKKAEYIEHIRNGKRLGAAAAAVGVSRWTACQYYLESGAKFDPAFKAAVDEAEIEACEPVEDVVREQALDGNITAAIFYLCNRMRDRWESVNKIQGQLDLTPKGDFRIRMNLGPDKEDDADADH